jgi:hypothetical protein
MLKNFLQLFLDICYAQLNSKQYLLLDLRKISYGSVVKRTYVRTNIRKSGPFILKNMLKNFLQLLLEICYAQLNSKQSLLLDLRKISPGSPVNRTYVRTYEHTKKGTVTLNLKPYMRSIERSIIGLMARRF